MKPKTARRILNRNAFNLAQLRVDKVKFKKATGEARKLLKQEKAAAITIAREALRG